MKERQSLCLLLCLLQLVPAYAAASAPPIQFFALAESDALAEEAILLLHCLSARANTSWEFSGEASGRHWLKVTEKAGLLHGTYRREESVKPFTLKTGGSEEACDALEPPSPGLALQPPEALSPALEGDLPAESPPSRAWLWAGLGAAAVVGFLFWKSRQPEHRGIEMKN